MYFLPTKLLRSTVVEVTPSGYWNDSSDPTDPWVGYPYQFTIKADIFTQSHSNANTRLPFFYDADDIKIGDWIASGSNGVACRVIAINGLDGSTLEFVVEDINRFNVSNDPFQSGSGGIAIGDAYIFALDDQAMPNLMGVAPGVMPSTFQTDLLSRFSAFNESKNYISFKQPNHTFVVGDVVYLDSDGLFKAAIADKANQDKLDRIVGTVSRINIPSSEYFMIKPRGTYVVGMTFPTSTAGSVLYIDPLAPGKLTATEPKQYAVPMYIRLIDADKAIYLNGGAGAATAGPLGYNASSYVVETLVERDALDAETLNLGDLAYVKDVGDTTWGFYEVTAKVESPASVTWSLLVSQKALETDASRIANDDASTFVETKKAGSLNKVVMGSNAKTVVEVEGSTSVATKGEKLTLTHVDDEVQLVAKNTAATGDVDVRVIPQGDGHVYLGMRGDGIVEAEKTFDLTVRGGLGTGAATPGDLFLTGGNSPSGNYSGGNVVIKPGVPSGTGNVGKVQIVDQFDTPVLGFKSAGETSSNYLEISNGANNADPLINGVKLSVAALSTSANVDIYMDPKGSGLVRVSDFATYSAALLQTGGNDALVTKSYVLGLAGLGEGEENTLLAGVGLTDDNGVFNVNVGAATIDVDGVNNLIVVGSGNAGELLMSTGVAGEQAVYGKLNLSTSTSFTGVLNPANGGLGFSTFAAGDILVGNGTSLEKVSIGGVGKTLFSTGTSLEYAFVSKLVDDNGASVIETNSATDPVNHFVATSSATAGFLEFGAEGTDANITVRLSTKGTGLLLASTGYSDNVGSDPDTIVTKGWVEKAIAGGSDSLTRRATLVGGWASIMNIGAVLPTVVGKDVYVTRAIVRVISPITGGGVSDMSILSGSNTIASAMESDVLAAGTYIVDLAETFASSNTQLTASFFGTDGITPATPTGGSVEITITYKIR